MSGSFVVKHREQSHLISRFEFGWCDSEKIFAWLRLHAQPFFCFPCKELMRTHC